jgi:DNA (cytosine-5)-methyltransferase 1
MPVLLVAGKRLGLDDPRGNLALEYVRLAERLNAQWMVFENVPGLLSSASGEDFAAFISAVTGHEYRSPATGWENAGIAEGKPGRFGIAWRILDAQFFGVAQRRRRVFVVGYRGDWRPAAAVLFEPESVRGNPAPSRKKGKAVAALTANGVGTCGADDNQGQAGHLIPYNIIGDGQKGNNHAYPTEVSGCLQHKGLAATGNEAGTLIASTGEISHCLNAGGMGRQDYETETLIAHTLRGDGFDASEDGTGRGTPLIVDPSLTPWEGQGTRIQDIAGTAPTLTSNPAGGMKLDPILTYPILEAGARTGKSTTDPRAGIGIGQAGDPMFTLQSTKQHAIAYPINTQMALRGADTSNSSREGIGTGEDGDPAFTLQANHSHAVALSLRGREGGSTAELSGDVMPSIRASQGGGDKPHILMPSAVRRLTPRECERLQGMPDDYTLIPWRKKPTAECPDGPRYKAIGNSMAVPCIGWILNRLDIINRALS